MSTLFIEIPYIENKVLVQIKDTFQKTMTIPTGIVLYAVNPNN